MRRPPWPRRVGQYSLDRGPGGLLDSRLMSGERLHDDEVAVDAGLVRALLRAQHPGLVELPLERVPSTGTVHWLFRLGDELIVRLPRIAFGAAEIEKDLAWLPTLATALPVAVAVPEPVAAGAPGEGYPWPWAVYRWIEGEHPDPDALIDPHGLAEDLAAVARALRGVPTDGAPRAFRSESLASRDEITRSYLAAAPDLVEVDVLTAMWSEALAAAPHERTFPWQHGDLLPGNLLLGPDGRLRAVIDWGCAGTADPAVELLPAWAVLPADARPTFRAAVDVDDATWLRGRAWMLSVAALIVPYYRDTNPGLAAVGIRALREIAAEAR